MARPARGPKGLSRLFLNYGISIADKAEPLAHLFIEKTQAGAVGLHPLAVDDELGDGALADVPNQLGSGSGCSFDVDLGVGEAVSVEEALRLAAIAAPRSGIEDDLHLFIIDGDK